MTDFWLAASAIGTLALAITAAVAIGMNMRQLNESKREFRASQQQQQENLEASQRPYLYPVGPLEVSMYDGNLAFDFEHLDPGQDVQIKNSGAGIAFNVRGALVQAPPRVRTGLAHPPRVRSIVVDDPLSPGEVTEDVLSRAGPFQFGWDATVGSDRSDTLAAPADAIVRLTLTYKDVFRHTHASQFDYAHRGVTGPRWVFHRFHPNVAYDLGALAGQHDQVSARNQAAFLNNVASQTRLPPSVNREPAE